MPTPWLDKTKNTKQLTVFPTDGVTKGPWSSVFTSALQEFNRISTAMNLGVTLVLSSTPPETNGLGGADVNFDVGSGTMNYTVLGNDLSVDVIGSAMHGHTQVVSVLNAKKQANEVIKAFTYVPATPMMSSGPAGKQIQRGVGDGVKLIIAVHELVHACGLSNSDHSPGIEADIFIAQPQPSPGAKPADDRLLLRLNPPNNIFAPPLFLTGRTAGLIRNNWK